MNEVQRSVCITRALLVLAVSILVPALYPVSATADMVFSMYEVINGDDGKINVVLSGEGSLDTSEVMLDPPQNVPMPILNAGDAMTPGGFSVGGIPASGSFFEASGAGPDFLLPPPGVTPVAENFVSASATGDFFAFNFPATSGPSTNTVAFIVPQGYDSGSALSGTATFDESLASMRLAAGDYVWNTGPNTISLSITAIPEPLGCVPLAALAAAWFLRRRRVV